MVFHVFRSIGQHLHAAGFEGFRSAGSHCLSRRYFFFIFLSSKPSDSLRAAACGVHHAAHLRLHILQSHRDCRKAAGDIFIAAALVGESVRGQLAVSSDLHAAISGSDCAVHIGVHIAHQHSHSRRKRRSCCTGIRLRGDVYFCLGAEGHALICLNHSPFLHIHAGVRVYHGHRQRQAGAFRLAFLVQPQRCFHLGVHPHGASLADASHIKLVCRRKGIARVHLARDIHAGAADLHVHRFQRFDGHIDDAAALLHLGQHHHIAAGKYSA